MAPQDKGRPLPKFGEWDVNNPASAEGFTVIFNKARDEKKTTGSVANMVSSQSNEPAYNNESFPQSPPPKKRWFCCG
ncbi:RPM1-interacting protein 4 [Cucurbita argyrosperma subsp. argyrosperma]|uniref:RPM1-interacting protein 4-like n=2 Tax=Cucurbita TaxID=3660 RepID=A0A6J1GRZ4_CUCMO